jgi:hypothetical protein
MSGGNEDQHQRMAEIRELHGRNCTVEVIVRIFGIRRDAESVRAHPCILTLLIGVISSHTFPGGNCDRKLLPRGGILFKNIGPPAPAAAVPANIPRRPRDGPFDSRAAQRAVADAPKGTAAMTVRREAVENLTAAEAEMLVPSARESFE